MNNDFFLKQLNEIIAEIESVLPRLGMHANNSPRYDEITSIYSKAKSAIVRICGTDSEYHKDAIKAINYTSVYDDPRIIKLYGVVKALKSNIENGYLKSAHELIQSEVFSEYIDMAEHLLGQGYKDAAAVIAGSTLEAHIRELARSNSIDLLVNDKPKKASTLNDELTKAGIYSSPSQKQVTAWLAIRNDAAHGNYDKYTAPQVDLMIKGIRQFTLK